MERIKVGIVEDEMIIADTICLALQNLNYDYCKPANSFAKAIQMIESEKPDIVLLDINLNAKLDGIDLGHHINANYAIPIIYLTANSDKATIERCKETLPNAFLIKPFSNEELFSAIEIALFSHSAKSGTLPISKNSILVKSIEKHKLTMREGEIILMISEGFRHKEIADKLSLSHTTVKKHMQNIFQKLGVQSSIDALNKLQEV
ncbi:MAG: response regulator transcription factor [Crocinitomicaceae bacterium]|nr:response regulator transcription factor [Crocinitomicaceae bacterium]MCF8434356.1 response regulator transcription factor [Crocinitomicaceae bacterium]